MPVASIPGIELGAELGRGSQSVVVRGTRGGRQYAVKLPLAAATGADRQVAYRRFLREAIALARARDASLPDVMEIGRAKGIPYLVMELATGESLADRLERGPLSESDTLGLALQIAGALDAIHAAGLVHRDVKPQNIVFDDRTGIARLVDLGSAGLLHGAVGLVGTPAYAAPELLTAEPRPADVRTDLYSLGRVLLACLGRASTPQGSSSPEGVEVPSRASPLSGMIARLVAVDPDERPASAAVLSSELKAVLAHAPVATQGHGPRASTSQLRGRTAEIEQLRRAWAGARKGSQVVFIQGVAGVGKTRVAKTFLSEVSAAGATVFAAGCHPRDPRAFSAVRQLVEGYLRRCDHLPAAERLEALAQVRKLGGDNGALLKLLSPAVARLFRDAPNIPASANAEQAFSEGLSEFLGKLVRHAAPSVVFVDDVQWLDPSSRRVLVRSLQQAPRRAVFLYGARSDESSRDDVRRLADQFTTKKITIDLRPLGGDDLIEIAREFLSARELAAEVKQAILRLSDGTPLSVLEFLRTLVDEGVLLPHWGRWQLDAKALSEMHLPSETASLLARRIGLLDPGPRSVLACGAVVGMTFEDELLSAAAEMDRQSVSAALAEARRADLVETDDGGGHRFIHHTVRDALLAGLDERRAREIHGRIAEALDDGRVDEPHARLLFEVERRTRGDLAIPSDPPEAPDAGLLYRLAYHYGASEPLGSPQRVSATNIAAGEAAVARFDNERAIEFFEVADKALKRLDGTLSPSTRLLLGDAHLRFGALDRALAEFDAVLSSSSDQLMRAGALVRIATIHELRYDSNRAWEALEGAFRTLGEELPLESPLDAGATAAMWLRRATSNKIGRSRGSGSSARDEMLCALYYEVGRVAFSSDKPGRLIQAALRALGPAERLGPSPALAKSYLVYSFVLTALGFRERGRRYFERAEVMVRLLRDPVGYSHTLQIQMVIAAWDGRMGDAIDAATRCLLEYGNWRELNEFCAIVWTVYQIETVRGRDLDAWRWLDLAIQRVNRHDGQPVVPEFLLFAARATLVGLGRENEAPLLLRRLERVTVPVPKDSGTYSQTFGPRTRCHTEIADLGPEFDALCKQFAELGQDPKKAHVAVFEHYLHVAHARVHACLRCSPEDRPSSVRSLEPALADVEAAARKIPLCRAHAVAVRGYHHFFQGRRSEALVAFEEAEHLAVAENAPWVLYSVYRGRAHVLRADGQEAGARDQATLAESIAREHGSIRRARWVREEFGLRLRGIDDGSSDTAGFSVDRHMTLSNETTSFVPGASRARRQLRALLRISQARAQELEPDLQARVVVDELVLALRAERGFLLLNRALARPSTDTNESSGRQKDLELVAARDSSGRDVVNTDDLDRATVDAAIEMTAEAGVEPAASFCMGTTARRSALAALLLVDDVTAGVVYVDRRLADGAFTDADGEVLSALAGQVSIALELTQALRARERAQETLRAAEKMDAVARLARGIGHDVNNMLSAVGLTAEAMAQTPGAAELVGEDIRAIQNVVRSAGELTQRLRDIAQGDFGHPQVVSVSARVDRLAPVIAGLLGGKIDLDTNLDTNTYVFIDPGQLDQIVMNLALNARDAMQGGGSLTIEVHVVALDESYTREHPRVAHGRYVRLSVTDTGHGMDADVREKIFEPYFTTKRESGGTGIGLSSVYWIVSRSGGHIDVTSAPGAGTTFVLYFPATDAVPTNRSERSVKAGAEERKLSPAK